MDFFPMLKEMMAPFVILELILFVAVVFVLRKLMYSASVEEMNRLKKLEEEHAKRTQELAEKLDAAEKQFKEKVNIAEDEARRISAQAKSEAEKIKEEALANARQESERIVNQALNTKSKVREELEAQLQQRSIVISQGMIHKIFDSKHMRLVHEGFIEEIIEELEKIDFAKLNITLEKGEIVSPYELEDAKKDKIASIISKKTGRKISFSEKTDRSIMAGIVLKIGSLVIDGSLSGKLKDAYEG